jgi:hypothetical protein
MKTSVAHNDNKSSTIFGAWNPTSDSICHLCRSTDIMRLRNFATAMKGMVLNFYCLTFPISYGASFLSVCLRG